MSEENKPSYARIFWARHKKLLLICLAVYLILIIAILILSRGRQTEPFQYQIF